MERGYLKEGDVCLDPFSGVALGALDAMIYGLHWIGCELEDKFVQLGRQNIDLWNRRYGDGQLRRWGTAVILQGDSRDLIEVLEGARAEGIISSPPYAKSLDSEKHGIDWTKAKKDYPGRQMHDKRIATHVRHHDQRRYGDSDGQLGTMPTGEPPQANGIVASPPYMEQVIRRRDPGKPGFNQGLTQGKHAFDEYGTSDGQLAAMREGDAPPSAIVSSPPWAGAQQVDDRKAPVLIHGSSWKKRQGSITAGTSDGQLAALPEGEPPQGIVSSPPYEESISNQNRGMDSIDDSKMKYERGKSKYQKHGQLQDIGAYSPNKDNLGNAQGDTFWSAAKIILLQCHQVLAPGGVAIWVLKDFIRAKKRVDFTGQWRALCESCGFETIEVIRAWLVEERGTQYDLMGEAHTKVVERKSFFRRLYEFKARAAKFWESVGRGDKAGYLWHSHGELWRSYRERMADLDGKEPSPPLPTRARILSVAQSLAYVEAGEPDVEIDTQIDYEVVLVMRKLGLSDGRQRELAEGIVSSPPYIDAVNPHGEGPGMAGNEAQRKRIEANAVTERAAQSRLVGYSTDARNLGNMPTGKAPAK